VFGISFADVRKNGVPLESWSYPMSIFTRFLKNESGATAIEYGLIAALIAVVIIGTLQAIGGHLTDTFTAVDNGLTGGAAGG
jgi:pilus assembly protein Flp/PilA